MAARIAMMAMTTSNSISVKPWQGEDAFFRGEVVFMFLAGCLHLF
jgi:hypothetical protein